MSELQFGRRAARSGKARSMVVFLHGYGADGADLLGLADPLAPHLPDTVFLAPDAPEPCAGNPFGRMWFPVPWLDGSSEVQAGIGLAASAAALDRFIDARLADEGLADDRLALVGFSQGTMMALQVAPRRARAMACVVGFSGRLLHPGSLAAEALSKPPVLLLHGDQDQMVPFADLGLAEAALRAAGFYVNAVVMKGMAHGIAPDGLSACARFLIAKLA